jgi:transaldolase
MTPKAPKDLAIEVYADGADLDGIRDAAKNPLIRGFTTNPTLMRKAGIEDYAGFAKALLAEVTKRPISFEVFADDLPSMEAQALEIASWGPNVNVKIPVTNTQGEDTAPLVKRLSDAGVEVNVTAVFTLEQVQRITNALNPDTPAIVSVFAGRIADTGVDPIDHMKRCREIMAPKPKARLLWASPRELLNLYHAEEAGAHIITMTNDLIGKMSNVGKSLDRFSLETVEMFRRDAVAAAYDIKV